MALYIADRAGADVTPCQAARAASAARSDTITGSGPRTVVIGDSWSVGLGLDEPAGSWPAQLPGEVHVEGLSGSGFSETASRCGDVSFAARTPRATLGGADLVVVEGGLNDFDQPPAATTRGFERLLDALADHRVVVVGPADAPSRSAGARRVDDLLERLSREHHVPYVSTLDLELDYLDDDLHLTSEGHEDFGRVVAERVGEVAGDLVDQP